MVYLTWKQLRKNKIISRWVLIWAKIGENIKGNGSFLGSLTYCVTPRWLSIVGHTAMSQHFGSAAPFVFVAGSLDVMPRTIVQTQHIHKLDLSLQTFYLSEHFDHLIDFLNGPQSFSQYEIRQTSPGENLFCHRWWAVKWLTFPWNWEHLNLQLFDRPKCLIICNRSWTFCSIWLMSLFVYSIYKTWIKFKIIRWGHNFKMWCIPRSRTTIFIMQVYVWSMILHVSLEICSWGGARTCVYTRLSVCIYFFMFVTLTFTCSLP